jgi:RecG-like helicase
MFKYLTRLFKAETELTAEELQEQVEELGASVIADLEAGDNAVVQGVVRSILRLPVDQDPKFTLEVFDGSGVVNVVFLGRRTVQGIKPGAEIRLVGRITKELNVLTIFNPNYTLLRADND